MAMGGLFGIGISGLNANQHALDTVGNNITNVYTEGFTREGANFQERKGLNGGIGVDYSGNQRFFDTFAESDLRNNLASFNSSSTYYDYASVLDNFLSNDSATVSKSLEDFFSSLQMTLASPDSIPVRLAFLNEAETLVGRFQSIDNTLDIQRSQLNSSLESVVKEVNGYSSKIAELNRVIQDSRVTPNSLLDERDNLLRKLSGLVPTNVVMTNDAANVYLGSGDALVVGGISSDLTLKANPMDGKEMDVYIKGSVSDVRISDGIKSAKLGGMLNFRREVLSPAKLSINHMAMVLNHSINEQHQKGLDSNGNFGGLFYNDINASNLANNRVSENTNNSGSASFQVTVEQPEETKPTTYSLVMNSPLTYSVIRKSDNETVSSGLFLLFPTDVSFDGLKMTVTSGGFASGDQYTIDATTSAIRNMELKIKDPRDLALAAPIQVTSDLANRGTGNIEFESVSDYSNPSFATPGQLSPPLRIEFLSPTSYQVVNADTSGLIGIPTVFNPLTGTDLFPIPGVFDPGYRIKLTGNMMANDKFNIDFNTLPTGDNRNGDAMAKIQTNALLEGGNNIQGGISKFTNDIANHTHFADLGQQSSKILLDSAQARRDDVSGVNLDEEAAMLLQYQKTYQASAQLISVADTLFDTVIRLAG